MSVAYTTTEQISDIRSLADVELRELKTEKLDDVSGGWYTVWTSPPPPPVLYPSATVVEMIESMNYGFFF
jgi:hypothetical protein